MKLSVAMLRKIIKEEVEASLAEAPGFLGRLMGGSKAKDPVGAPAVDYASLIRDLSDSFATSTKSEFNAAVRRLHDAFEGSVARGANPQEEAEVVGAVLKRAGASSEEIEKMKHDLLYRERNRAASQERQRSKSAMESAVKGLVTDPETKAELIALLTAKRDAKGAARRAASAAVTSFLGKKLPGFDAVELHGTLSRLYGL